jgi:MoaA/NifB/PqqE/SkfB family radical SAM enzyme
MINSVITKQNYKEAPQLAKLLKNLKVDYFQYAFPHI